MKYSFFGMSKFSDMGLLNLIIGTILIVLSLIFTLFTPFSILIFIIQIIGWILFCIALTILIITKDEYRVLKLKKGFPLKLDSLIIFICAMLIAITSLIVVDINVNRYTGNISFLSILYLSCFLLISMPTILLAKRKKKSN